MENKPRRFRHAVTPVSIFAGMVEVTGAIVLPSFSPDLQGVFLWFLILFPVLFILLFFGTLNFNPRVLYAPIREQIEKLPDSILTRRLPEHEAQKDIAGVTAGSNAVEFDEAAMGTVRLR